VPRRVAQFVHVLAVAAWAAPVAASDGLLSFGRLYQPVDETDATLPERIAPPAPAFGEKGHRRLTVQTGVGVGLEAESSVDVALSVDFGYFIATDLELAGELSLWGFFQDLDDAAGVSTSFVFRYHYINRERWSAYFDAGIGPLFATDNVPQMGTGVNFMPRLGLGLSVAIDERETRLVTGIRWHHVSNARIGGETRNPDRDGVFVWAGLSVPF